MSQLKFVRTTHLNGRFRPFPTEAYQFWQAHGWLVGEALRQETGMSFSEMVEACQELIEEHPEAEPYRVNEPYLAWCLVRLLEFGMVTVKFLEKIEP